MYFLTEFDENVQYKSCTSPAYAVNLRQFFLTFLIWGSSGIFL